MGCQKILNFVKNVPLVVCGIPHKKSQSYLGTIYITSCIAPNNLCYLMMHDNIENYNIFHIKSGSYNCLLLSFTNTKSNLNILFHCATSLSFLVIKGIKFICQREHQNTTDLSKLDFNNSICSMILNKLD